MNTTQVFTNAGAEDLYTNMDANFYVVSGNVQVVKFDADLEGSHTFTNGKHPVANS